MNHGFIKSSPHFFRLIIKAAFLLLAAIMGLAVLIPAPLQEGANRSITPNPVKSAWFLLWIQELVSWTRFIIWGLLAVGVIFVALPWLSSSTSTGKAEWFSFERRWINIITVLLCLVILLLTITALFFRGENWSFNL